MVEKIPKMNTFIYSNMAPQYETHNTGPWENYTRQRARTEKGDLFVITGVAGELLVRKIM